MSGFTNTEEFKAIKDDIEAIKKEAKDLNRSLDGIIDQINRALSHLKERVARLEQAAK